VVDSYFNLTSKPIQIDRLQYVLIRFLGHPVYLSVQHSTAKDVRMVIMQCSPPIYSLSALIADCVDA